METIRKIDEEIKALNNKIDELNEKKLKIVSKECIFKNKYLKITNNTSHSVSYIYVLNVTPNHNDFVKLIGEGYYTYENSDMIAFFDRNEYLYNLYYNNYPYSFEIISYEEFLSFAKNMINKLNKRISKI